MSINDCRHCEASFFGHQPTSFGNFCPGVDLSDVDWSDDDMEIGAIGHRFAPMFPQYVSAYERTLSYGGPEEGGWHRDHYEPMESVRVDTRVERDEMLKRMRDRHFLNEDGSYKFRDDPDHEDFERERARGASSCARGHDVVVCAEYEFASRSVSPEGGYE